MTLRTKRYDVADHLVGDDMIAVHLDAAFKGGDVARARGMTKISRATGLAREQLYKTLSADGKPELSTVLKIMAAFGGGLRSSFPRARNRPAERAAARSQRPTKTRKAA
jgi:probable addiction module antidote protein